MINSVRKYGFPPYQVALLHGGPGAAGEMKPVAEELSKTVSILELLQTKYTINSQIEELYNQLENNSESPVTMIGYSWGAWLGILFSSRYPEIVRKLILISSGALDAKYNADLTAVRLTRLTKEERREAQQIQLLLNSHKYIDNKSFERFGKLMSKADSYCLIEETENNDTALDKDIFQSVWKEAEKLRESGELIENIKKIKCPVIAFHGEYDPHPMDGVEKPLSENVENFRWIRLEKCGHTPWKEKYAKEKFYNLLQDELISEN